MIDLFFKGEQAIAKINARGFEVCLEHFKQEPCEESSEMLCQSAALAMMQVFRLRDAMRFMTRHGI